MTDDRLKSYLFAIDSSTMSLDKALEAIDKIREIENWQIILPDVAVLVSRLDIDGLHEALKEGLPKQKFLITLLEQGKKQGWLAKASWAFMNNPTSVYKS